MEDKTSISRSLCVSALLLLSSVLSCASIGSVQVLERAIPPWELNALRFVVQTVVTLPVVLYHGYGVCLSEYKNLTPSLLLTLVLYFLSITLFNAAFFTASTYVPVGTLGASISGICTLCTAAMSICFKQDRSMFLYLGAFLSCIGMVLMVQPAFMFKHAGLGEPPKPNWTSPCKPVSTVNLNHTNGPIVQQNYSIFHHFLVTVSGILSSCMFQLMSRLVKIISAFSLAFWNALFGTTVSVIIMSFSETVTFPTSTFCVTMLLIHCIGVTQVDIIEPYCLKYLSPLVTSIIETTHLVVLLVLQ